MKAAALIILCALALSARADDDYDRLYTPEGMTGMCLDGKPIGSMIPCDDKAGQSCFVRCSEKCDSDEDCEAFMINATSSKCQLYSECDVVGDADACPECMVHVCIDDCQSDIESYYGTLGSEICKGKPIGKAMPTCTGNDCYDECAAACEANGNCTEFVAYPKMSNGKAKCNLYDDCSKTKTIKGDKEVFMGHLRMPVEPEEATFCAPFYRNWKYKGTPVVSAKKTKQCLTKCAGHIVSIEHATGACSCYVPGTTQNQAMWEETSGTHSSLIMLGCEASPVDKPVDKNDDTPEDGCVSGYGMWSFYPRGDSMPEDEYMGSTVACMSKCDMETVIVPTATGCECYDDSDGGWMESKKAWSFMRESCPF